MLATATHDHKRGEDVRARIDVLCEMPLEWRRQVGRWARLNRSKRREVDGQRVPGRNDEYLLYQTLVGAWPLELDAPDHPALAAFAERIVAYMLKALARGQGPHQLGRARRGLRGGPGALRAAHPRSSARGGPFSPTCSRFSRGSR